MDRFMLTWKLNDKMDRDALSDLVDYDMDLSGEARNFCCLSCVVDRDRTLEVRHMIEYVFCIFVCVSAKKALVLLKSIPVAAKKSLPVLINQQGKLISIPVSFSTFFCCKLSYFICRNRLWLQLVLPKYR
ncbi:raspberry protein, putative [Medicago truncatula]|uniref:Raspberry protein, putative n=1 Tax=Medicago truncatula TaxID=3880 RepID=G7KPW7_MEDTR|nr:raspberry protein, putative [Medicago truncatula]